MTPPADAYCDCAGAPPWPPLLRLSAPGPDRYYLCRRCGRVRKELCRPDGTIQAVLYYERDRAEALPPAVAGQVQQVLQPRPEQLRLFEE